MRDAGYDRGIVNKLDVLGRDFRSAGQVYGPNNLDIKHFDISWSTGLAMSGLLAGRDQDHFGMAYAQERNGEKWRDFSGNAVVSERLREMTCRCSTTPAVVLQPTAQYLISHRPGPGQARVAGHACGIVDIRAGGTA
ncbi:MAG: carbohydrate porin [Gallionella sp.]